MWWWWRRKPIEFYDLKTYIKAQHFTWLSQSTFCCWGVGMTWVGSVVSAKNPLVERIVCKGTWCLNTAMLVSPNFKQFQLCFHRNVSGFASSTLLPSMIAGMIGSGKTASVRSLLQQASEAICLPPEIIIWCYSQWQSAYTEMLVAMPHIEFVGFGAGFVFWCEQTEFDRVWWSDD